MLSRYVTSQLYNLPFDIRSLTNIVALQSLPKWSVPIEQSTLKDDIAAFWKHILDERIKKGIVKVEEEKDETPVTDERSQQSDDPTPSPAATDK